MKLLTFKKTEPLSKKHIIAALTPVVFVLFVVLFAYDSIQQFALSGLITFGVMTYLNYGVLSKKESFSTKIISILPFIFLFVGAVGLGAAYSLAQEERALALDPNHVASCSINPIISCSSVMQSTQGSALGVSNTQLGLIAYGALMLLGFELLLGLQLTKNMWRLVWLGSMFALGYSLWLISQSLYVIGSLCLYCSTIWLVTIPLFFYVTNLLIFKGYIPMKDEIKNWLEKNHMMPTLVVYSVIIILIYFRWSDYWNSLLP